MVVGMVVILVYVLDYDGYFCVGFGVIKKDVVCVCYNLGGVLVFVGINNGGGYYCFGNECDFYGEFGLVQMGIVDGVMYKGKIMVNEYNGGMNIGDVYSLFEQMYVEVKGFDILLEMNFWVGKCFYGCVDIYILDKFFVQLDGVGVGVDNILVGGGKLGIVYFMFDSGDCGVDGVGIGVLKFLG